MQLLKKNWRLIKQPIPKTDLELTCEQAKQNPVHIWSCFGLTRLLSAFTADTPGCTRSHYQVNVGTYHSSQLTPIYPRAFTRGRGEGVGVAENRGSDAASRQRGRLARIKALPWVGGKGLGAHPQCSAAEWNNANQALITASLARGSSISRNYTQCKFGNKRPHNYSLISPHIRFHGR